MQALRFSLTVACLLIMHVAILRDAHAAAIGVGLACAGVNLAIASSIGGMRPHRSPWLVPLVLMAGAQLALWFGFEAAVTLVLAPSIVVNAALFVLFGHTLLPDREPLITRFRRIDVGHVAPKFRRYTRLLTLLWTIMFGAATAAAAAAALWGSTALWSWIAFIIVPAASLSFFLGEHAYRAARYGREGRSSPLRTLRIMLRPDAWQGGPTIPAPAPGGGHD